MPVTRAAPRARRSLPHGGPAGELITASRSLARATSRLRFAPPVAHVYDPLVYARAPHEHYLRRWGGWTRPVLLVGMNPGPFGMVQTGVPFGDVAMVRDFLGVRGEVGRPAREHPARPVQGFACPRAEVSGARLWGWVRDRFARPEAFFARAFVHNWCPLAFLDARGRNLTPDRLPAHELAPLIELCDLALVEVARALQVTWIVGVGAFAAERARAALARWPVASGPHPAVGSILHPSPANPAANRGWARQASAQLSALGVPL